jgi:predicted nucleic acid-binding protein
MRRSKSITRIFFLDTNVFVSAIKDPRRQTATLSLLLRLIEDPNVTLVGNDFLVEEMMRYAQRLGSETAAMIIQGLVAKMEIVKVKENFLRICRSYIDTHDSADIAHAATCLQTSSVLISNDHHFDRIRDEQIIRVMSASEALKLLIDGFP